MFLNTLSIGKKTVKGWVGNRNIANEKENIVGSTDNRLLKNKEEFLLGLSNVESHYCRSLLKKLYLELVWDSYRHVYRTYQQKCQEEQKKAASWSTFWKVFKNLNLDIQKRITK